jgi:hypothetical protein
VIEVMRRGAGAPSAPPGVLGLTGSAGSGVAALARING